METQSQASETQSHGGAALGPTIPQIKAIKHLQATALQDFPRAEVKDFSHLVIQAGDLRGMALVTVEVGFPTDELEGYRYLAWLRARRCYIVSERGRVERWNPRRGYGLGRRARRVTQVKGPAKAAPKNGRKAARKAA